MKNNVLNILLRFLLTAAVLTVSFSCSDWKDGLEITAGSPSGNPGSRTENEETRKVMLLYSAGYNSLTSYLKEDIEDLKKGWLPGNRRPDDVVLVYSHFPEKYGAYNKPSSPTLVRLYCEQDTTVRADTLVVYSENTISASARQLNEVLTYVKNTFSARSYGLIFSSHATGYLPAGYYQKANQYQFDEFSTVARMRRHAGFPLSAVPYEEPEIDPSMPLTKSIGQDQVGTSGSYLSYEIELQDFADAIPMHLDYILFDACLMGGVEVAYELHEKTDMIGFSQTEVLAEGFDYKQLTTHLLQNEEADPERVCEDYFVQYDIQDGVYRSATISLVDCTMMDELVSVCRNLFDTYREQIRSLDPDGVQQFFRSSYHWFYDLESILKKAGATEAELNCLYNALDKCMIYKAHTPEFMNAFDIHTYCGLSMYLPSQGSAELDKFYETLKWNQATGLVR